MYLDNISQSVDKLIEIYEDKDGYINIYLKN